MQGEITFISERGWYFAKCHADDFGVFIQPRNVEHRRYLRMGDIISFDRIQSVKNPNDYEAINVKFIAHAGALVPERDGNQ